MSITDDMIIRVSITDDVIMSAKDLDLLANERIKKSCELAIRVECCAIVVLICAYALSVAYIFSAIYCYRQETLPSGGVLSIIAISLAIVATLLFVSVFRKLSPTRWKHK